MMFNNKKGATQLWWIIMVAFIAIVAGILIMIWFRGGGDKSFLIVTDKLNDFGDCDRDKVANMFDKCPCLSTENVGDEDLRGCPKGTTNDKSEWDKQTCMWFIPPGGDPDNPVEECPDNTECESRCETIKKVAVDLPSVPVNSIAIDGDLQVTTLTIKSQKVSPVTLGGKYIADLEGANSQWISIESGYVYKCDNCDDESITKNFDIRAVVCNKFKKNCEQKTIYDADDDSSDSYSVWGITKQVKADTPGIIKGYVLVGDLGDACDGEGTTECWLQIEVNYDGVLAEKDPANNKAGIDVVLKNKELFESSFKDYKSIELEITDYFRGADPSNKQITQFCDGYIGDDGDDEFDCPSGGTSCGNNEFPSESGTGKSAPWNSESKGCLLVATNFAGRNKCGYAGADNGVIIDKSNYDQISPLKTIFFNSDGNTAIFAMQYAWKATSEGSLICNDEGYWNICNDDGQDKTIKVGSNIYKCDNDKWVGI